MFKKTDPNPQLDIFTAPSMQLGSRASKKYSDPNAWHNQFYSHVTTKIDEEIFKPLFPEGKTRYRGLLKHRMHAYSRCMWVDDFFVFYRRIRFPITNVLKKIVGNNLLINKSGFGKLKVFLCFWLSVLCEKYDDRNQWTICETEFRDKCAFIRLVCRRKIELCFCAILLPFVCCPLSSYSWLFFK